MNIKDERKFSFTIVENDIVDNLDFTKNEVMAYLVLARYSNSKDSSCFPSYNTIAKKMRCSRKTAIDAIESLVKKGVIKKTIRKTKNKNEHQSNIYVLIGVNPEKKYVNEIEKQRGIRNKQLKQLNEHKNVILFKDVAPHIRIGRLQKLELLNLDYNYLDMALDRAMVYGANSFKYVMDTYKSICEEQEMQRNKELFEKEIQQNKNLDSCLSFYEKDEFVLTDAHVNTYVRYCEFGEDCLTDNEKILLYELRRTGRIK